MSVTKCPICGGSGVCHRSFYEPWSVAHLKGTAAPDSRDYVTCKACDGKGVHFSGPRGDVQADMRTKPEANA